MRRIAEFTTRSSLLLIGWSLAAAAQAVPVRYIEFETSAGGPPKVFLEPILRGVGPISTDAVLDGLLTTITVDAFSDDGTPEFRHNDNGGMGSIVPRTQGQTNQLDGASRDGFEIRLSRPYTFDTLILAGDAFGGSYHVTVAGKEFLGSVTANGGSVQDRGLFVPANAPLRLTATAGRLGLFGLQLERVFAIPEPSSAAFAVLVVAWRLSGRSPRRSAYPRRHDLP